MLLIHNILDKSTVNGPGLRTVIWTQGCTVKCTGCSNKHTWSTKDGQEMGVLEVLRKIEQNKTEFDIDGVTFSGGEPLEQFEELYKLLVWIKTSLPSLDVMLYTGRSIDDIQDKNILKFIDVLVDGPFEKDLLSYDLTWRGSTNQRVHLLNDSIKQKMRDKYNMLDDSGQILEGETGHELMLRQDGEVEATGFGPFSEQSMNKLL